MKRPHSFHRQWVYRPHCHGPLDKELHRAGMVAVPLICIFIGMSLIRLTASINNHGIWGGNGWNNGGPPPRLESSSSSFSTIRYPPQTDHILILGFSNYPDPPMYIYIYTQINAWEFHRFSLSSIRVYDCIVIRIYRWTCLFTRPINPFLFIHPSCWNQYYLTTATHLSSLNSFRLFFRLFYLSIIHSFLILFCILLECDFSFSKWNILQNIRINI